MEIHVERGRIRAVLPNLTGVVIRNETASYEFPGATVLPGFVDAHCHVLGLGALLSLPSLHEAASADECIAILQQSALDESGWIQSLGWNETRWAGSNRVHKSMLDEHFPNTPIAASRIDGHTLWVNSEALRRAGIEHPTGVLSEDERNPVVTVIPPPSNQELQRRIVLAANVCSSFGITEVHDMDVHPDFIETFRGLAESGKLPIRVQSFVSAQNNEWISKGLLPAGGEFQRTIGIKMYADGALGSRTAAMLQPFADDNGNVGRLLLNAQQIAQRIRSAINEGWWCVAVHAIGDKAAREVLDAFAIVRSWHDGSDIILRMEHAQIVNSEDLHRFAELNAFAIIQPTFATSDARMAESRLGADRVSDGYRWRTILNAKARIAASSDFPIESANPLLGIDAFIRRTPKDTADPWTRSEVITQQEAVLAYTTWPHEASDVADRRGTLNVGYDADVVVLDADPRTCPPEKLTSIKILATFTAGLPRYLA